MPKATPALPYQYDPNGSQGANNLAKKNYLQTVRDALYAKGMTDDQPEYQTLMGQIERQLQASTNAARIPTLTHPDPTKGGSSVSASGQAPEGSGYSAWINPHNGSTFFGVTANGQRVPITRAQAEALGAPPEKRITGDFYGRNPGDPGYEAPPPVGGGGGGGGGGNPPPPPPPGGGGGNPPPGGGGGGGGNQPDWGGWGQGAPSMNGGGGYDPADYAFMKYVPGQESPWGIPEVRGGNKDFYRNQFINLLTHDQSFQDQELKAKILRDAADKAPLKPVDYEKAWAGMNLPEVQLAQKAPDGQMYTWNRDPWIKPGVTTNAELYQHFGGQNPNFDPNTPDAKSTAWGSAYSPTELANNMGNAAPSWINELQGIWNKAYTRADLAPPSGGGPTAAPGYALPIAR